MNKKNTSLLSILLFRYTTLLYCSIVHAEELDAHKSINLGDRLWCQEEYHKAEMEWKKATQSKDYAVVAQANYRLLLQASNLGWAVYGVQGDIALSKCSTSDPYCGLANVDREIFMSLLGLPSDLAYAENIARRLIPYIPAEAMARLVWLEKEPKSLLAEQPSLDGFGACLQNSDWTRGPGGAYYGFGMYGGGRLGVGASASWTQPNIDGHGGQLQLSVSYTTQKAGGVFASYSSAGDLWIRSNVNAQRRPYYLYIDDTPNFYLVEMAGGEISPGYRWDNGFLWLGLNMGVDYLDNRYRYFGPTGGIQLQISPYAQWRSDFSYSNWDYYNLRIDHQLMWIHPTGFASMFNILSAPNTKSPWWRKPTIGGGNILRTTPAHRWRDEIIPSAVFEYRHKPQSTLGVVAFTEMAYAEKGIHGGGGLGLRIRMPPQPYNTMRIDIGYGDMGWNVLFGAEEFFRCTKW